MVNKKILAAYGLLLGLVLLPQGGCPSSPEPFGLGDVTYSGGTILVPGASILLEGNTYDGATGVQCEGLVAIIKDGQAYFYHSALGNATLSEDTSRRAVGAFLLESAIDAPAASAKSKDLQSLQIGASLVLSTGVSIQRIDEHTYEATNPKRRWVAIKRGSSDRPKFIMPGRTWGTVNIVSWAEIIQGDFSFDRTVRFDVNDATEIETFAAVSRGMLNPAAMSEAVRKSIPALEKDAILFIALNAIDFEQVLVDCIFKTLGAFPIPGTDCVLGPARRALLGVFEDLGLRVLTGDEELATQFAEQVAAAFGQKLAQCACEAASGETCKAVTGIVNIIDFGLFVIDDSLVGAWDIFRNDAYAATPHTSVVTTQPPVGPSAPSPATGAADVSVDADLDWADAAGATSYDVYLGTTNPPPLAGNTASSNWPLGTLNYQTTCYWKIVAKNNAGDTAGPVWLFTTQPQPSQSPATPSSPNPANGATGVSIDTDLDWADASGATSYDVYFGTSNPPPLAGNPTSSSWPLGTLSYQTTYYWRIVAKNSAGSTAGPVWSFTTTPAPVEYTWSPLGSGLSGGYGPDDGTVRALTVYNSELFTGGNFTIAGGVAAHYIARWNGTSWQPVGVGFGNDVYALTEYDGDLIAGGSFRPGTGDAFNFISRWNGTSWQPLGTGMNLGPVRALVVYNGELIAGGYFTSAGGVSANRIARWNGTAWQPLGAGVEGDFPHPCVDTLTVYNGELIAGGAFTSAGGVSANMIARWNGTSWQPLGSGMSGGPFPQKVSALTVYDNELIAGGWFTAAGGVSCNYIARWNGSSWAPLGGGLSSIVDALAVYNGDLVEGGANAPSVACHGIASWNGAAWEAIGSGMGGGSWGKPVAVTVFNGDLIAGGIFTTAGGVGCKNIARWGP